MKKLTHLDSKGSARMVDVGRKQPSRRMARASAFVRMKADTLRMIRKGNLPKGEALNTARLAGILAAKRVDELIPLTHSLPLDHVEVDFSMEDQGVRIMATASVHGRTGVEMEALTAAAIAALAIYDMAKSVDKGMVISDLQLEYKSGGRSGTWVRKVGTTRGR
jgi:cyclic pyranopterin phosphate synthase